MAAAVLGIGIAAAAVVASAVFVDRYADAPGEAADVNERMAFDAVPRYDPDGKILFVTVAGPHVTALQGIIGWIDPDIRFDTYKERFGDRTPEQERSTNLRAMRTAKDDAPYVAMAKLGYPATVTPGPVRIDYLFCEQVDPDDQRKCLRPVPADAELDPGDDFQVVDGTEITTIDDLSAVLARHKPGDTVSVTVSRLKPHRGDDPEPDEGGLPEEQVTADVTLTAYPDQPDKAVFGVVIADTSKVTLPFPIDIDSGAIGGPSAGLAFALTVMDELTPGELTGGAKVAVTGTINVHGEVGAIGGIHQKAAAVKRAGATAFIVPASQSEEDLAQVRKVLGADRVYPVSTFDEALAVLTELGGNAATVGTPGTTYHAG